MATAEVQQGESGNFIQRVAGWPIRLKNYYEELQTEMRLVTWPSWKQVRATTGVVHCRGVRLRRLLHGGGRHRRQRLIRKLFETFSR